MTVTLCDSPKSDNICRAYLAKSLTAEKAYYDGLTKKSYSCQTVELGQPIRIKDSIKNLLAYNYGWIDYGDGFRYYFSISDVSMVSESMTDIIIELDPLASSYNQIGIQFPRVSLQRFNGETPNIASNGKYDKFNFPYNPMYYETKAYYSFGSGSANFAFLFWDSANNKFAYGVLKYAVEYIDDVFNGEWMLKVKNQLIDGKTFDFQMSDLTNMAFVPFDVVVKSELIVDTAGRCAWSYLSTDFMSVSIPDYPTLTNSVTEKHRLYDARGNVIFEPAVGEKVSIERALLSISVSTISVQINLKRVNPQYSSITEYEDIITLPCETIDVYVDSWTEYAYRQRQYDIELRNINAKSSLANIGNSAMSGLVGGAVTGSIVPGIGTAVGAVAGLAVGAISSAIGTGITYHYGSEEQKQTDALYQKAVDTLSLIGNASAGFVTAIKNEYFVRYVTIDKQTFVAYTNDIDTNGYYYTDTVITDFLPSSTTNSKYAIKADVEIDATIPTAWKNAIADRFAKGMIIEHD